MAKIKTPVGPYGAVDSSGVPTTETGMQKYIESMGGTYVSPASRMRADEAAGKYKYAGEMASMGTISTPGGGFKYVPGSGKVLSTLGGGIPDWFKGNGPYHIDASGNMVPGPSMGDSPLYKYSDTSYSAIPPYPGAKPTGGPPGYLPPGVNSWTVPPPGGGGSPGAGTAPQFDPAAAFNQRPNQGLPGLNTGGVNPYLTDPLMAGFRGQQNPLYLNQNPQDFYGDPELFGGGY